MTNMMNASPWGDTKHDFWAYVSRAADRYVEFLTERKDISARVLPDTRPEQDIAKNPRVPAFHHPASRTIFVDASVSLKSVPKIDANMNLIRVEDRVKYPILSGLLFHEMSHAMHTLYGFNTEDEHGTPLTPLEDSFVTNMEEFRCEYNFAQKHKGDAEFVFSAVAHINFPNAIKTIREISTPGSKATEHGKLCMALNLYFLIVARVKSGTVKSHLIPQEITNYLDNLFDDKDRTFLSSKVDDAFALKDTDFFGLLDIAREIISHFGLNNSPEQEKPQDMSACDHPTFTPPPNDDSDDGESEGSGEGEDGDSEQSDSNDEEGEKGDSDQDPDNGAGKPQGSPDDDSDEESDDVPDDTQFQKESEQGASTEGSDANSDEEGENDSDASSSQSSSDKGKSGKGSSSKGDSGDDESSNDDSDKDSEDGNADDSEDSADSDGENDGESEWPSLDESQNIDPDIECLIKELELQIAEEQKAIIDVDASKEINARVDASEQKMRKETQERLNAKALGKTIEKEGVAKDPFYRSYGYYYNSPVRTFEAKMGNRKPTASEQAQAKDLEDYIRRAQFRSDTKHLIDSELPPGRFRTSQAMKLSTQRSLQMAETATPWKRVKREVHENPELNVAMAIDFSGSMDRFLAGVSGYGWILSQAVKRNRGTVSSVFWDTDVYRGILPTEFNETLVQPRAANGASSGLGMAVEGVAGLANLLVNDNGVNMLVILTDSDLPNYSDINHQLGKLMDAGVSVLWLSTTVLGKYERNRVMKHPNITKKYIPDSAKFAEVVTDAIEDSLLSYQSAW